LEKHEHFKGHQPDKYNEYGPSFFHTVEVLTGTKM